MWREVVDRREIRELKDAGLLYWSSPSQPLWRLCSYDTVAPSGPLSNSEFAAMIEYGRSMLRGTARYAVLLEE